MRTFTIIASNIFREQLITHFALAKGMNQQASWFYMFPDETSKYGNISKCKGIAQNVNNSENLSVDRKYRVCQS